MVDIVFFFYFCYGIFDLFFEYIFFMDYDFDWDVFYFVFIFLDMYKFDLFVSEEIKKFIWLEMKWGVKDIKWEDGVRKMVLIFNFVCLLFYFRCVF